MGEGGSSLQAGRKDPIWRLEVAATENLGKVRITCSLWTERSGDGAETENSEPNLAAAAAAPASTSGKRAINSCGQRISSSGCNPTCPKLALLARGVPGYSFYAESLPRNFSIFFSRQSFLWRLSPRQVAASQRHSNFIDWYFFKYQLQLSIHPTEAKRALFLHTQAAAMGFAPRGRGGDRGGRGGGFRGGDRGGRGGGRGGGSFRGGDRGKSP